jgi:hypothetical protein
MLAYLHTALPCGLHSGVVHAAVPQRNILQLKRNATHDYAILIQFCAQLRILTHVTLVTHDYASLRILRRHYAKNTQWLHSDYAVIRHVLRKDYAGFMHKLHIDYALITH